VEMGSFKRKSTIALARMITISKEAAPGWNKAIRLLWETHDSCVDPFYPTRFSQEEIRTDHRRE